MRLLGAPLPGSTFFLPVIRQAVYDSQQHFYYYHPVVSFRVSDATEDVLPVFTQREA